MERKSGSAERPSLRARALSKSSRPAQHHPGRWLGLVGSAPVRGWPAGCGFQRVEHSPTRTVSAGRFTAVRLPHASGVASAAATGLRWRVRRGQRLPGYRAAPGTLPAGRSRATRMDDRKPDAAAFGRARAHRHGHQSYAAAVDQSAPGVVRDQLFANELLDAVGGVRNRQGSRRGSPCGNEEAGIAPEDGLGTGEDKPRLLSGT